MKRISPDISDEAKAALDTLCAERKQTMSAVISDLILQNGARDQLVEQIGQYLVAIHTKLDRLCTVLLEQDDPDKLAPVTSEAERYGTEWVQPVDPLPIPTTPQSFFRRLRANFTGRD